MPLSSRACATVLQVVIVLLGSAFCCACTGRQHSLTPAQPQPTITVDAVTDSGQLSAPAVLLPELGSLPRLASQPTTLYLHSADQRIKQPPFENRIANDGDTGVMSPDWPGPQTPADGLAWCVIPVHSLDAYSGSNLLYLGWDGPAPPKEDVWIALSDHSAGRWRLRQGPGPDEQLELGQISQMLSPEGVLHIAVILGGQSERRLVYLLFGETLIGGELSADPNVGTGVLQTTITVNHEVFGGTVESFDLDSDGDGSFEFTDDSDGVFEVFYDEFGQYHPRARINPSNGAPLITESIVIHVVNPNNIPPTAALSPEFVSGPAPQLVSFDATESFDSDGSIDLYEWDFDGDGSYDESTTAPLASFNYGIGGTFSARLRVTDSDLASAEAQCDIGITGGWQSRLLDSNSDNELIDAAISGPLFQGRPLVVYKVHLPGVSELRAVRSTDTAGSNWSDIEVLDDAEQTGSWPQVISYDFRPAVVYARGSSIAERELIFQRAAEGGGWDSPQLVSATLGGRASLSIVNALPLIACSAGDNSLNVFKPDDDSLANWSSVELLGPIGGSGQPLYHSLSLFNNAGVPRLLFSLSNHDSLQLFPATDSSAEEWTEPLLCFQGELLYFSHRQLAGQPAVGFVEDVNMSGLYYSRSFDSDGQDWPQPVLVDDEIEKSHAYSLASVNGLPALAYVDSSRRYIVCSFASDVDGADWQPPLYVASHGDSFGVSVEMISAGGGRPLVFHQRRGAGSKYELVVTAPPAP